MSDLQQIMNFQEYAHISIDLKSIMDARGINRNTLARSIGARFEVIDKWYNGEIVKLDLDVLARICFVLECEPSDILKLKK